MARLDADIDTGGIRLGERFFRHGDAFRGRRVHRRRHAGAPENGVDLG
jgi:selenium-binding protein 1